MSSAYRHEFEESCRNALGGILIGDEYRFDNTYIRPRGIAVEFSRDDDCLFAVNEGGVISLDLIRRVALTHYYRISLNQLLWHHGVRSLPQCKTYPDQLAIFATELPAYCAPVLSRNAPETDARYCFPMSQDDCTRYLLAQRGE